MTTARHREALKSYKPAIAGASGAQVRHMPGCVAVEMLNSAITLRSEDERASPRGDSWSNLVMAPGFSDVLRWRHRAWLRSPRPL